MSTMQEHTEWLQKYCSEINIRWVGGAWNAEVILKKDGSGYEASGFADIDECTRQLCDEVCEALGEDCK